MVVPPSGSPQILDYYTLVTRTVDSGIIPTKGLPRGPVGVVLLGRLAVDQRSQGQGIGKRMLLRALRQTAEASLVIGIHALVLDALDDKACEWYLSLTLGFQALHDDSHHLFLPVGTIRMLEAASQGTILADHFSPTFRPAFPSSAIISERSSPSRVRSAAPNNGAPLTAPGRSEQHL